VLTGPNLYFPSPTVKLTLDATAALHADPADLLSWQRALALHGSPIGLPGSPARGQAAADLAAALVRRAAARLRRRVAAVGEVADDDTVIAAFPFTWRGTAEALGVAVASGFDAISRGIVTPSGFLATVPQLVPERDAGEAVRALRPRIPVIAVTGTNGKTTTTRLVAHLLAEGGHVPGWSSTDGIVVAGEVVETGDWSGPGGAARVLSDPRVTVAVTETARGGILLRGVGTATNDVSVVTNISADHLGLLGVHTLEQLARVKAVVPRITRPTGWAVLNADDPLVLGMRAVTRARPWLYSLDPTHRALREALDAGGRAMTVLDDHVTVLRHGLDPTPVAAVADIPLTLAGTSAVNISNVLAATAAALATGATLATVRAGLAGFAADAAHNSGRLNLYEVGSTVVVLDLAHNEASLSSLLGVAAGLRLHSGELVAVVSTAGDRADVAIHAMGAMAASRADRMVIAGKSRYLRGRDADELIGLWRSGAAEAGVANPMVAEDEVGALRMLLDEQGPGGAMPPGSIIAVCALEQRPELVSMIEDAGGHEMLPAEIADRVAAARV
jgi:cyanophycin synthetase